MHEKGRRNFGGVQSGAVHRVCYLVFWLPVQSCAGGLGLVSSGFPTRSCRTPDKKVEMLSRLVV